ncbi:MAG: hypothetical protein F6K26_27345 [Moorea sp. SIO2I5]|nr:hypothetical protein [Moorena sp. SIO2I5]
MSPRNAIVSALLALLNLRMNRSGVGILPAWEGNRQDACSTKMPEAGNRQDACSTKMPGNETGKMPARK